jgi:hypothetical protein
MCTLSHIHFWKNTKVYALPSLETKRNQIYVGQVCYINKRNNKVQLSVQEHIINGHKMIFLGGDEVWLCARSGAF